MPNTSATAASSGADLNGAAVKNACETLRERLAPRRRGDALGVARHRDAIVFEPTDRARDAGNPSRVRHDGSARATARTSSKSALSATGFYRTPGIGYDRAKGKGKPFHYFAYGAAVTEVEVDGSPG